MNVYFITELKQENTIKEEEDVVKKTEGNTLLNSLECFEASVLTWIATIDLFFLLVRLGE